MTEEKRKIGFVILTWNSEKVIYACLASIFAMEAWESHVVVIDNGSADGTLRQIEKVSPPESSTLEVIEYGCNRGTTTPRNAGLARLWRYRVGYYCILDSDTIVNEDAFVRMAREMDAHPRYGIIGPHMQSSDGTPQNSARVFPTVPEKFCKGVPIPALQAVGERMERQELGTAGSCPVDYLMSACWLIRPEALAKTGLLDEKIFYAPEDAEYCIRMWKAGYQVAYCPGAQIVHEWQRLSKKKLISRINWEHVKGLAYLFVKHGYAFSTRGLRRSFPK